MFVKPEVNPNNPHFGGDKHTDCEGCQAWLNGYGAGFLERDDGWMNPVGAGSRMTPAMLHRRGLDCRRVNCKGDCGAVHLAQSNPANGGRT